MNGGGPGGPNLACLVTGAGKILILILRVGYAPFLKRDWSNLKDGSGTLLTLPMALNLREHFLSFLDDESVRQGTRLGRKWGRVNVGKLNQKLNLIQEKYLETGRPN